MSSPLIRPATRADIPLILEFIRALADYEKLAHEVEATDDKLAATLFPADGRPVAQCVLAFDGTTPAGFALFFYNYSTWLARPGRSPGYPSSSRRWGTIARKALPRWEIAFFSSLDSSAQ